MKKFLSAITVLAVVLTLVESALADTYAYTTSYTQSINYTIGGSMPVNWIVAQSTETFSETNGYRIILTSSLVDNISNYALTEYLDTGTTGGLGYSTITFDYKYLDVGSHIVSIGWQVYDNAAKTIIYTGAATWYVNIYGGTPTYTVPSFTCKYGTKLSDLKFDDSNFHWQSDVDSVMPVGTYVKYATYSKPYYDTVNNIPITVTISPFMTHYKMEVH